MLEPRAAAARVALTVRAATPRAGAARTSAWQLTVPSGVPEAADRSALPLAALDLFFADGFYTRPAVLLTPDRRAPHGQRVLQQGTLRASRRVAGGTPDPQTFDLGELRAATLGLEVRDGDNAPLTLTRADAVVWVPRLTFKAAGGEYRLLFGNTEAAAPTYDLADLRQDVLAYSAIPLEAKALQPPAPNADYAPRGARRDEETRARPVAVDRPRLLDRRAAVADEGDPQVAAVAALAAAAADALSAPPSAQCLCASRCWRSRSLP